MIDESDFRSQIARQSIGTPLSVATTLRYRMRDEDLPEAQRLQAARFLVRLFDQIADILKTLIEAGEDVVMRDAVGRLNEEEMYDPSSDLQDLEAEQKRGAAPDRQKLIEKLRPSAEAHGEAQRSRNRTLFELGAWLSKEVQERRKAIQRDNKDADPESDPRLQRLAADARTLGQAAPDPRKIVRLVTFEPGQRYQFPLLTSWFNEEMSRQRRSYWSGDWDRHGYYWAALLLLAGDVNGQDLEIKPDQFAPSLKNQLVPAIDAVLADRDAWEDLLPSDPEAAKASIVDALNAAETEHERLEAEKIAAADLDEQTITRFRAGNEEAFARVQRVATLLAAHGRVSSVQDETELGVEARAIEEQLPRSWFVAASGVSGESVDDFGAELGRDQDRLLYQWIREAAREIEWKPEPLDSLRSLISEFAGAEPHIFGPTSLRRELSNQVGFERSREAGDLTLGTLDGIPAHVLPLSDRVPILLVDLAGLELTQVVRPGAASPLEIQVQSFTPELAADWYRRGARFSDKPEWTKAQTIAELVAQRVIVRTSLTYELDISEGTATTVAIPLEEPPSDNPEDGEETNDQEDGANFA